MADAFQANAAEEDGSIAAIHPDWYLLLNASYLTMAHPKFVGHKVFGSLGRMVWLVDQLALNVPAQQTAAALICSLHHSHIEHSTCEQERFQLLQAAFDDGKLDAVLTTLASILQASQQARSTLLNLILHPPAVCVWRTLPLSAQGGSEKTYGVVGIIRLVSYFSALYRSLPTVLCQVIFLLCDMVADLWYL